MSIPLETLPSGFSMPKLGFGTWKMGNGTTYGAGPHDTLEITAIRQAVEKGLIHIDTAELYGAGYVEEMVAKAFQGLDRSQYFLTSKVMGQHATYEGIHAAVRSSLARLKTDYLDLYLIHYRRPELPLEPAMVAMSELVDQGLVKNIGVSNFTSKTLQEAQGYSSNPIVCNQVQYSLVHREAERDGLLDYCRQNDVILVAWGPVRNLNHANSSCPIMHKMVQKYSKSPVQIAINWLTSQTRVCTLVKASDRNHLQEDIDAVGWEMELDDVEELRSDFPDQVFDNPGFPMR